MKFLIIFSIFFFITTTRGQFTSPCPSLFRYDPEGVVDDRWYGTIVINPDTDYSGVWLRAIFDRAFLELGTDFGEAVQREPNEFLIRNSKYKLSQGQTLRIRIYVRFNPTDSPPKLTGFRLNGRSVCPEEGYQIETTTQNIRDRLISPCPESFTYEIVSSEQDRWYGNLILKSDSDLNGVWLRIVLDRPSLQLGVSDENWFGEVSTEDNIEYLIKNRNQKITAGEPFAIRFFIKYNTVDPPPMLLSFRLNAKTVCPKSDSFGVTEREPSVTRTTTERYIRPVTTTTSRPKPNSKPSSSIFGSDFDPNSRPGFLPGRDPLSGVSSRYPCGTVAAQPRPLITHGEVTAQGQWPWHAALYYPKGIDLQYICGASLISLTHVLSAAHCVARKSTNDAVNDDDIEVYLGKYNLRKFSTKGIQAKQVKRITIHPDYNYRYYTNDIAVLELNSPAEYTDYVRPVCLWSENVELNNIVDKEGTVVGWGYDETGKVTEYLTKAKMPVVSYQKCVWSYPEFFSKFTTEKTFCAGFRNGTSVCNGDSGGGLVFPKINSNPNQPVWQIRGVVSLSVALQSEFVCDTSHYAIFTDTAKYLDWIKETMVGPIRSRSRL